MEKKKVKISYACPIPWETMKDVDDKYKYCGTCKLNVRDFTKEDELDTAGTHCGRFRMDQVESINRTFSFNPKQVFVVSLLSLLGMAAPLAGQSEADSASAKTEVKKEVMSLKGFVSDSLTGEGIPFANVVIKNKDGSILAGGASEIDGSFTITISRNLLEVDGTIVEVTVIGYESKKMRTPPIKNGTVKLDFSLNASDEIIEVIVFGQLSPISSDPGKTFSAEDIRESPYRQ